MDHLPGTTVNRYCSSSLQTTRMAFHAIKAGEGDVFISAGVETVSRYVKGNADGLPDTQNPVFDEAQARTEKFAARRPDLGRPAHRGPAARRLHRDGPDRRERRPAHGHHPRGAGRVRRPQPEPRREGDRQRLLGPRHHAGDAARRHRRHHRRRPARRGHAARRVSALKPVFRPDGTVTAGNCCPLNDGAAAVVVMSDTKAQAARAHAAGPDRQHRRHRPVARDHGPRPGRGLPAGPGPRRPDHRRHRPGRDQRGLRRPGDPVRPRARASTRTGSTSTAARSRSATRSA